MLLPSISHTLQHSANRRKAARLRKKCLLRPTQHCPTLAFTAAPSMQPRSWEDVPGSTGFHEGPVVGVRGLGRGTGRSQQAEQAGHSTQRAEHSHRVEHTWYQEKSLQYKTNMPQPSCRDRLSQGRIVGA